MITDEFVRVDRDDNLVTVTLDRPGTRNACTMNMWLAIRDAFRDIAARYESTDVESLRASEKRIGFKAPIALRIASQLIDQGAGKSIEQGLAMELSHLEEIFSTADAYEGLSSLGKRRPVFKGE